MVKNLMTIVYATFIVMSMGVCTSCGSDDDDEDDALGKDGPKYEYVDLGLSVKWATCNIGASSPEEYGYDFAWAETKARVDSTSWGVYDAHSAPFYQYYSMRGWVWTKYTSATSTPVLYPENDAATINLDSPWRMPTKGEVEELINQCMWEWITLEGTNGYKVTGSNGKSIFLPAAGFRSGSQLNYGNICGCYWSSSLSTDDSGSAYGLYFTADNHYWRSNYRYIGCSVRPVRP